MIRVGTSIDLHETSSARRRALPKLPGFAWVFFLILFGLAAASPVVSALAQTDTTEGPVAAAPATGTSAASDGKSAPETKQSPDAGATASDASAPLRQTTGAPAPANAGGSSLIPHDLSPYGMFLNADIVVKIVMVGLAFASFVTWTILIVKTIELFGAKRQAGLALVDLAGSETLRQAIPKLDQPNAPVARMANAALAEIERSRGLPADGVKERATALLGRIEARAGRSMARGTGVLATIGSTAPFVGLFGTVWGIMNSFIGISKTNTTNLAVVAPGIAEALLATAFGLVAAIPAVIIYNAFARGITGYRSVLGDASTEVLRLLSRDLDRDSEPGSQAAARRQAAE